jgi:predicted negative regulator of RcsB-dependent stress response
LSLESRKSTALQDPGAEMVDQLTSVWARYGRIALGVVGALIVIAGVAYFTIRQNAAQDNAASKKLSEADMLFWQGDYERSKTAAQEVSRTYGSTPSGVDGHRIAGDDLYWRGDFKGAIVEYKAYLAKQGKGIVAQAVQRSLAYAYDSDKQFGEAARLYDGLVGVFDRESSAEMLMASSRCNEAAGNKSEAVKRLQRLVDEFGDSSLAMRARVKLAELGAAAN